MQVKPGHWIRIVHFAFPGDEPFEIERGIMLGNAADEIIARLVTSGQYMGHTGPGDVDRVGELRL